MIEETFPAIQKVFEGQFLNTNISQHLLNQVTTLDVFDFGYFPILILFSQPYEYEIYISSFH
jgi:hypothetical protein